jgi:hypothetical protein
MITVTLNFTTISAAVAALCNIPENDIIPAGVIAPAEVTKDAAAPKGKPSAAKTATSPATAEAAQPTAGPSDAAPEPKAKQQEATPPAASATSAAPTVERGAVSKAAVALAMKDKPKIVEILSIFNGAKGVKDLVDSDLAAAFKLINAALGA